jgi:hypothetical protein
MRALSEGHPKIHEAGRRPRVFPELLARRASGRMLTATADGGEGIRHRVLI